MAGRKLKEGFAHSGLDVYYVASALFVSCWRFADGFRTRDVFLRSQFLRAALSIKLNIAEGATEFSRPGKARFYRMARRSAAECAAILDDLPQTLGVPETELESFYRELNRISKMLLILSGRSKLDHPPGVGAGNHRRRPKASLALHARHACAPTGRTPARAAR